MTRTFAFAIAKWTQLYRMPVRKVLPVRQRLEKIKCCNPLGLALAGVIICDNLAICNKKNTLLLLLDVAAE